MIFSATVWRLQACSRGLHHRAEMRGDRSDLDQLIKEDPSKQLRCSLGHQNGSAASRSDDCPDVVLWFWRCSSLPRERSPIPPSLQASEAALLYLGDGGQQSWVSARSHLCSPFLLFHTDNKPLRSVSVWRLCVLNLSSDAASSSTCLCWRRRTENYCWETTETLKKLCLNRIYCIVVKGNCESADCRRSLNGGLRLKLLLGIYVWDQPLSPGLLPKIPSSIKGHEASIKKQHSK